MDGIREPKRDLPLRFDWTLDPKVLEKDNEEGSLMEAAMKLIEIWRRKIDEHEE